MKANFFIEMPTPAGVKGDGLAVYDSADERLRWSAPFTASPPEEPSEPETPGPLLKRPHAARTTPTGTSRTPRSSSTFGREIRM
jgi:hypothetical protein